MITKVDLMTKGVLLLLSVFERRWADAITLCCTSAVLSASCFRAAGLVGLETDLLKCIGFLLSGR